MNMTAAVETDTKLRDQYAMALVRRAIQWMAEPLAEYGHSSMHDV